MALIRCPKCNLAITDAEALSGACPDCSAPLPREAPVEVKPKPPEPPRTSRPVLWAVIGTSLAWLILTGAWLLMHYSAKPALRRRWPGNA